MRVLKPTPWLAGLGALLGLFMSAQVATADVTTDQSASILVFPKVIADGTRDTLIQISNTGNGLVYMHCVYVDASLEFPFLPPGPTNPRRCVARDFELRLTKQQPTIWRVSTGRLLDLFTAPGSCQTVAVDGVLRQVCPGFDPGNVPNVTVGLPGTPEFVPFEGELKCIEIDAPGGSPVNGNHLKGEAVIEDAGINGGRIPGNISAYNAIGVVGISPNSDSALRLDDIEYNKCPARLIASHSSANAVDPVWANLNPPPPLAITMQTELTVVPCTEDLLGGVPETVNLQVFVVDEMESRLSAPTGFTCWFNETLDYNLPVFDVAARNNSAVLKTEIRSTSASGVLAVTEEFRMFNGTRWGSEASNVHVSGVRTGSDTITLHAGTPAGTCVGGSNQGDTCFGDGDCLGGGSCCVNVDPGDPGVCLDNDP